MKYMLVDGVERNEKNPSTFSIPSAEEKAAIIPGDFVKAGFESPINPTERMWVKVTKIEGEKIEGTVANYPVFFDPVDLKFGDVVVLETKHVLDIMPEEAV